MRRDRLVWLGMWGALAWPGGAGCTKPRTVLSLRVNTDQTWGDGATLRSLVVTVRRGGVDGPLRCAEGDAFGCPVVLRLGTGAGQQRLPLTFQLSPAEPSDQTGVWVEVLGCGSAGACSLGDAVVSWSRALAYSSEQTETVEVLLTRGCDGGVCVDGGVPDETGAPDVVFDGPCASPRMECGGRCVDTSTDVSNCGACGRACRSDQTCQGGACGCAAGRAECAGGCRDLRGDPQNCGVCGVVCPSGGCANGVCECLSGQTRCGAGASASCVDVQTSRANCGACGRTCSVSLECERGACVAAQRSCRPDGDGGVPAGCGLVRVERGTFTMGAVTDCSSGTTATCAYGATPPQANVTVDAFTMDAYEVTVGRFRAFWRARMTDGGASIRARPIRYPDFNGMTRQEIAWGAGAGREPEPQGSACNWSPSPSARDAHPINCVDWWTAQEFCVWDRGPGTYGTPQNGRLPTEAEWEYAARGRALPLDGLASGRTYPWGEQVPQGSSTMPCDRAQWNSCVGEDGGGTRRVGRFAAVGGFFDLAGNVWEWMADNHAAYTSLCVARASSRNPICNGSAASTRVFRGGAWDGINEADLRSASRGSSVPVGQDYFFLGFRCAGTEPETF